MTAKDDVSRSYLDIQKSVHGSKLWISPVVALMSGDLRAGSIGEMIHRRIVRDGGQATSLRSDVRDKEIVITRKYNTLIMCHGATYMNWFEDADMDKVQELFDVNVVGSFRLAQAFVRRTIDLPYRKKIIMIGSMAHKAILNGSAAYCASKAALAHLSRCMAWELAAKGFDVYCVHPSNVDGTPMAEETIQGLMAYRNISEEEARSYWSDNYIRGRSLSREEIADIVTYLLGNNSAFLSGSQIELGGGQR